jgi:hypothetical protein
VECAAAAGCQPNLRHGAQHQTHARRALDAERPRPPPEPTAGTGALRSHPPPNTPCYKLLLVFARATSASAGPRRECCQQGCTHHAQMWQGPALDALAAWLAEDGSRVEPRLASRDACQRFVALFAGYTPSGDGEALLRLLDPFLRILRRSPRITARPIPLPATVHNTAGTPFCPGIKVHAAARGCCHP